MTLPLQFCVCFLAAIQVTGAANILYVSSTASPSHNIWDKTLAMALRERHHNITFFTHSPEKSIENFTTIIMEGVYDKMHQDFQIEEFGDLSTKGTVDVLFEWILQQSIYDLETEGLQTMIKQAEYGVKFDLIIWDMTTGQSLYPLIEKFNFPPTIVTSPFGLIPYFTYSFGIDCNSAYIPLWMMPFTEHMTFLERVQNYLFTYYFLYQRQYVYMPASRKLAEKVFGKNIASFDKIEKHMSLLLSNSDPIFDFPQPVPPAVIHVGGLHTKRNKDMPQDIQSIMDNAKHGVILFSLGTNIRSDKIGLQQRQACIKAFSMLKEIVLWKFESEIQNLPSNVIVREWLPQNDILAHPNLKLFISHGGGLSTQEAMFHGVPIIGMPFFADQHINMHKCISRNLGLKIDYNTLTSDIMLKTLKEILNNPTYKENMQTISRRYRDQPQNALDRAIFWVEYTLRHKGAQHLRIAARDIPIYKLYFLDMWAIFAGTVLLVKYIICSKLKKSTCKDNKLKVH